MTDLSTLTPTPLQTGDAVLVARGVGAAMVPVLVPANSFPTVPGPPATVIGASGTAQTVAFPASGSIVYDIALTANCVITLAPGGVAGQRQVITLLLRQGATGGFTVTLPATIKWSVLGAPTLRTAANGVDIVNLSTADAGVTIQGTY